MARLRFERWADGSSRRRTTWVLVLGLLLLSTVGVRCFAISENNKNRLRPHSSVDPLPRIADGVQGRLPRSLTRLFGKGDEDGPQASEDANSDPNEVPAVPAQTKAAVLGNWPCFDQLDRELIRISLPVIGNYAINPLIGAVDLFWVNRMGNALAVAGQAAANQVFSSAFWFTSFLPSGTYGIIIEWGPWTILESHDITSPSFCSYRNPRFEATRQ